MRLYILAKIEALIFTADKLVLLSDLARLTGLETEEIKKYIDVLKSEYNKKSHGIFLKEFDESYIFVSKEEYAEAIRELHNRSNNINLSHAALETLAIIAYKQPVTRTEIEAIRGVKAEKTLITLSKYNLIEELGRKDSIGNPIVYGTNREFLRVFGLRDLSQLPDIEISEDKL
jgi:segregation and condensation protein B